MISSINYHSLLKGHNALRSVKSFIQQ